MCDLNSAMANAKKESPVQCRAGGVYNGIYQCKQPVKHMLVDPSKIFNTPEFKSSGKYYSCKEHLHLYMTDTYVYYYIAKVGVLNWCGDLIWIHTLPRHIGLGPWRCVYPNEIVACVLSRRVWYGSACAEPLTRRPATERLHYFSCKTCASGATGQHVLPLLLST